MRLKMLQESDKIVFTDAFYSIYKVPNKGDQAVLQHKMHRTDKLAEYKLQ